MKEQTRRWMVWWTIIGLTMLLLWAQSLFGRDLSNKESELAQGILGSLFGEWIYDTLLYRYIRKVAHFAEYALLGMEWAGYRLSVHDARRPTWRLIAVAGPVTAACDELLQFISARSPSVADVLLDCIGYACGFFAVMALWNVCRRMRKKHSVKK